MSKAEGARIRRINMHIGAEVSRVDLRQPLTDADIEIIHDAWVEHEVLIFRDQDITIDQQIAFGRSFGELSVHPFSPNLAERPEVIVLDNHADNPPALTDQWHSDETFREAPPNGTILRANIIPEVGGDTMFASMTAAFAGLSDRMQNFLSGLEAYHDFKPFRGLMDESAEARAKLRKLEDEFPNPLHPVVRQHPVSTRPVLNVNPQFTIRIKEMREDESDLLLAFLFKQATIPEYQFRASWQPHTILFWDNRSVQHYAAHDYFPQRRQMTRLTIAGEKPYGIADSMVGLQKIAELADRRAGLKAETGPVATRQVERN